MVRLNDSECRAVNGGIWDLLDGVVHVLEGAKWTSVAVAGAFWGGVCVGNLINRAIDQEKAFGPC
jgi:hypothetical protein